MSAEVFVSYSSQDHAHVSKIIERLHKAGVSVWMDEGGIDAGVVELVDTRDLKKRRERFHRLSNPFITTR